MVKVEEKFIVIHDYSIEIMNTKNAYKSDEHGE